MVRSGMVRWGEVLQVWRGMVGYGKVRCGLVRFGFAGGARRVGVWLD